MFPYFLCFLISVLFGMIGEFYDKKNKINKSVFFYILSILTLSVLAGIRDTNIGTDLAVYAIPLFEGALSQENFIDFYLSRDDSIEPLYMLLTYCVSIFTDDVHWLLFFVGVIIYGFMFFGIRNYYGSVSVWMAWAVFIALFYGYTLNLLRQSMAMSILFWGFHYVIYDKHLKFWISFLVAFCFHKSAIVFIIIYFLYIIIKKKNNFYINSILLLAFVIGITYYGTILEFLISLGILPVKFYRYVGDGIHFSINPVLIRVPFILFSLMFYRQFTNFRKGSDRSEGTLYVLILILDLISVQLRMIMSDLYRLSMYFGMYSVISYSRIYFLSKNKVFVGLLLVLFLIVVWIYQNVIQGNSEIYPYTSIIIGV